MKTFFPIFLILCLAFGLRVTGIHWGLPTDEMPFSPLHPDERFVMDTLQQMNWSKGDFNPEPAHREGALAYYIWSSVGYGLKSIGVLQHMPWEMPGFGTSYGNFILSMRAVNILLDTASVLILFLLIRGLVGSQFAALLGALLFALTPFEIIYAHYSRTHTISNFFLLLVFAASVSLLTIRSYTQCVKVGLLAGMATACRYPTLAGIVVPISFLTVHYYNLLRSKSTGLGAPESTGSLFRSYLISNFILGAATVASFFVFDPFLFLDFESARPHLLEQASFIDKSQFGLAAMLDPSKLWTYLSYLFPYGTRPYLWVLFYFGIIYCLLSPALYRRTGAFLAFVFLYFIAMAKGYTTELVFIRGMIGLFPACCLLSAVAIWKLWERLKPRTLAVVVGATAVLGILLSTLAYDIAYVTAMTKPDPRMALAQYFARAEKGESVKVGVYPYVRNFVALDPPLEALSRPRIEFQRRDDLLKNPRDIQYIVIPAFEPFQFEEAKKKMDELVGSQQFLLAATFRSPVSVFGYEFRSENNPHDLQYPFPTLYLLKRVGFWMS